MDNLDLVLGAEGPELTSQGNMIGHVYVDKHDKLVVVVDNKYVVENNHGECLVIPVDVLRDESIDYIALKKDNIVFHYGRQLARDHRITTNTATGQMAILPLRHFNLRHTDPNRNTLLKKLGYEWYKLVGNYMESSKMRSLGQFIAQEAKSGKQIYPRDTFRAFKLTPFHNLRVVIIGQDPYATPDVADGLAFSTSSDKTPPSLRIIKEELRQEYGRVREHNSLTFWAHQGVLLLNRLLSVEANKPLSHANKGWEQFTELVIRVISEQHSPVVFMLWGKEAQRATEFIDTKKHLVLTAPHPAYEARMNGDGGFYGCNHFKRAQEFVASYYNEYIDWF